MAKPMRQYVQRVSANANVSRMRGNAGNASWQEVTRQREEQPSIRVTCCRERSATRTTAVEACTRAEPPSCRSPRDVSV